MSDLGLAEETEKVSCKRMWADFSWSSAAHKQLYFDVDWASPNKCKAVGWATAYSALVVDDYKRCVCDRIGASSPDC